MQLDKNLQTLACQSVESSEKAFDSLIPIVTALLMTSKSRVEVMGLVQALFRCATLVAHYTIGTQLDTLIRKPADAADLAAVHWNAAIHLHKRVNAEIEANGGTASKFAEMVAIPDQPEEESLKLASLPDGKELAKRIAAGEDNAAEEFARLQDLQNSKGGES